METLQTQVPCVRCERTPVRFDMAWDELDAMFAATEPVAMKQAWQDAPSADFRPAWVRTAWNESKLFIYAVLDDDHIFNPVLEHNAPAFTEGDVFEIFLRPDGQDAYFEFHVNPHNQRFQLRIPSAAAFHGQRSRKGIPVEWLIHDWRIESRVEIEAEAGRWRTLVGIPFARIVESGDPAAPGRRFHFSFSRYDYPEDGRPPVLSSTSPHAVMSFHRQEEWGRLVLA